MTKKAAAQATSMHAAIGGACLVIGLLLLTWALVREGDFLDYSQAVVLLLCGIAMFVFYFRRRQPAV